MQVCTHIQECKYASMQVCKYASMQVYNYASMKVCKILGSHIQLQGGPRCSRGKVILILLLLYEPSTSLRLVLLSPCDNKSLGVWTLESINF